MPAAGALQDSHSKRDGGGSGRARFPLAALLAVGLPALVCVPRAASADVDAVPVLVVAGPDPGVAFEGLAGVAVEPASGEIAIAERSRGRVLFFGSDGWLLGRAVHSVTSSDGGVKAGAPTAIAYDRQGNLLVVDSYVPYVDVLDYLGSPLARLELPGAGNEPGSGGGAVAVGVGPDGRILVASRGDSARIHVFSPDYEYVGSWGTAGADSGQLNGITGVSVMPDGQVVVACARTVLAVQIFDQDGRFVRGFGAHEPGPGSISLPGGVVVTSDGRIWVADEMRQVVQVYNAGGESMGWLGGWGTAAGDFQYPSALATDGRLQLVVAERVGNRVQVLRIR